MNIDDLSAERVEVLTQKGCVFKNVPQNFMKYSSRKLDKAIDYSNLFDNIK